MKEFYHCGELGGNSAYFADDSRSCRHILVIFDGVGPWDVSLVTDHSIPVLSRITIRVQEILTESLRLRDTA